MTRPAAISKRAGPGAIWLLASSMFVAWTTAAGAAPSAPPPKPPSGRSEIFAIVIGVNEAHDRSVERLRFADDDALGFHRILSALGTSTLLTSFDRPTQRLHAGQSAQPPTRAAVLAAIERTLALVAKARARGHAAELYFVYSGHGDSKNNAGYLTLTAGGRFTSTDLASLLARSQAVQNHVLVDACDSFYLIREKRAGGQRTPVTGRFHRPRTLLQRFPTTGFVLSTSGAAASHEWDRFQAGIFSHELRSAFLGAADVDGDRAISYGELGTFLLVANRSIRNELFRPKVFVRPPAADATRILLRLPSRGTTIRIPPSPAARYYLETAQGVRLADFHQDGHTPLALWRPTDERVFVHDVTRRLEYAIAARQPNAVETDLAKLTPRPKSYAVKGAVHEAFRTLFAEAYGLRSYRRLVATLKYDEPSITQALGDEGDAQAAKVEVSGSDAKHLLFGGYQLRRGYLQDAALLHGVALGYLRWFGRIGVGGSAAYGGSRYARTDGVSVRYDDLQLGARVALRLGRLWRLAADVSAEANFGWGFQAGTVSSGEVLRATQPLFGYGGQLGLELRLVGRWGLRAELQLGQLFLTQAEGVAGRLRLGGGLSLTWRP